MTTPLAKVIRIKLSGVLAGQDKVFRGHTFIEGSKVMCATQNSIAAVLNSMRGRLPHEVEDLDPQEGLEAYRDYCQASGTPLDMSAIHQLGKAKGMVDLKVVAEDDTDAELDAELDDLLNQDSDESGEDDEDEEEDDSDSSDVEDSDENDNGNVIPAPADVDPAVARENSIRTALGQLDHDNPDHWTAQGLPKMTVLEDIIGDESISRREVTAVNPDFKRNH